MIKFFQKLKAKKGFTLVELIVVIAIIGVLAAILIPTMLGYVTSSRVQSANSTAAEVKNTVNNWITALDTKGYSIKRSATVITYDITFGTSPSVSGIADTQFTKGTAAQLKADLEAKIKNDYPADTAVAKVFIKNGSVLGVLYYSGSAMPATDVPTATTFENAAGFTWTGTADGVTAAGEIVGTSPQLVKSLGC